MQTGLLIRKAGTQYFVLEGETTTTCSLSATLRKNLVPKRVRATPIDQFNRHREVVKIDQKDPVAVGDIVDFVTSDDNRGVIKSVHKRKNRLSRRAAGKRPIQQVIAANIDRAFIVFSLGNPAPKWNFVDRFLAGAESENIEAVLCLSKSDLAVELPEEIEIYKQIGYRVILFSSENGDGLDEIDQIASEGVSVVCGPSGVGKTTLLNRLLPDHEALKTEIVSDRTGKGQHTTRSVEMHFLPKGGALIDTPGVREFGVWHVAPEDMGSLFPEIRPLLGTCKFGNRCSHTHEPQCAIQHALEEGTLDIRRLESCFKLIEEAKG